MVGIAIGLAIVTALLAMLVSTNRHNAELARSGQISESGRFALQLLANEISHAGFWGGYLPAFDDLTTTGAPGDVPNVVPDPCLDFDVVAPATTSLWTTAYKSALIGIPLQAYEVEQPVPVPAVPVCGGVVSEPMPGSDFITVRGVERCVAGAAGCTAKSSGDVFFQFSRCPNSDGSPNDGRSISATSSDLSYERLPCDGTSVANWFRFESNLFYVRDHASAPGDGIPTLVVSRFGASSSGGTVTRQHGPAQALIPGVQVLAVELGLDSERPNPAGGVYAVNFAQGVTWQDSANRQVPTNRGDGLPDSWVRCGVTGCTADQLLNVVAVRLHVLVRSETATPGYTDTKTYTLAGTTFGPFNDGFRRNVYSRTVRLHNVSMRRETTQ
jgi:type IV pilus assembly protein PilW